MNENLIVGLDIGTTKVCAAIGEYNENNVLEIIGIGSAPSTGLRRGVVVNIESTLRSVSKAIENAELMSGREVTSCYAGIGGSHIDGLNSRGVVAVTGKGREIVQEDVSRVIEAARAVVIPMDREVFHVIPQIYTVDDQPGIRNPIDMIGVRLEGEVHIVTGSVSTAQNLVKCINRAGFKVEELWLQSLAAAKAVLTNEEKDLGCILIDIGGGTTDVLLYQDGAPYLTSVIPVGGAQVTSDLSIVFNMPLEIAEKIKIEAGSCIEDMYEATDTVIIPGVAGRPPREVARKEICTVMMPRIEEIFLLIKDKIDKNAYTGKAGGGIVLTGGGSLIPGVCELASRVFGLQARIGFPQGVGGMVEECRNPSYSTAIGLVLAACEHTMQTPQDSKDIDRSVKNRDPGVLSKILNWFKTEFN